MYPAYSSYKAVKTKNVKEYVKWMMYWVTFAFFLSAETITDLFVSWIPFYCEVKILFLLWILSPTTKGSSIVYRKLLHPQLSKREQEIDSCIDMASFQGYSTLRLLGVKALTLATDVVLSGANMGQIALRSQLQKSLSVTEATDAKEKSFFKHRHDDLNDDDVDVAKGNGDADDECVSELDNFDIIDAVMKESVKEDPRPD